MLTGKSFNATETEPHTVAHTPHSDGTNLSRSDRCRAIRLALCQLHREAAELQMPLTSHLIDAAAEASQEEAKA